MIPAAALVTACQSCRLVYMRPTTSPDVVAKMTTEVVATQEIAWRGSGTRPLAG